ncbi:MAG: purine-nucleoside phosphorylase [Eudoraea sp.]|uniref:purine-nucleoside phosphorylase n=1 Tax=Eudoraea sp. TaxID=1979955 RepID=UPI003C75CFE7
MSIHIDGKKGDVASTVLMPGDPLRAKWIAETYLENVKCYSKIRGMLGFTGEYNGNKVSVQGSGMGIPSSLIYYHELINEFDVNKIIRLGTAGSYQPHVKLKDLVIAISASTNSSINNIIFSGMHYSPTASFDLAVKASTYAKNNKIKAIEGNVLSSDVYYEAFPETYKKWAAYGVLCVEMETAGLYTIAAKHQIEALALLTISDSLVTGEICSAKERESTFNEMVEVALQLI